MPRQAYQEWTDVDLSGKPCQTAHDADGDRVIRYDRRRVEPRHPDAGATTPHRFRAGWVSDWIWPTLIVGCFAAALVLVVHAIGIL